MRMREGMFHAMNVAAAPWDTPRVSAVLVGYLNRKAVENKRSFKLCNSTRIRVFYPRHHFGLFAKLAIEGNMQKQREISINFFL